MHLLRKITLRLSSTRFRARVRARKTPLDAAQEARFGFLDAFYTRIMIRQDDSSARDRAVARSRSQQSLNATATAGATEQRSDKSINRVTCAVNTDKRRGLQQSAVQVREN